MTEIAEYPTDSVSAVSRLFLLTGLAGGEVGEDEVRTMTALLIERFARADEDGDEAVDGERLNEIQDSLPQVMEDLVSDLQESGDVPAYVGAVAAAGDISEAARMSVLQDMMQLCAGENAALLVGMVATDWGLFDDLLALAQDQSDEP